MMEFLRLSTDNNVGTVTINRPPANALSGELLQEMSQALDQLENNDEVRVILIHGEGRFFSAGADIKEFTGVTGGDGFENLAEKGQNLFERMETFSKPIIAAIHGAALGGGLELAMGCHIRLVSESAKLGLPELQLGIIPGYGGTQRLTRYVGPARAAEMMFTSDPISGLDAVKYGLANNAYPEEELLENAQNLAKKIAKKSPQSLKAAIELINYAKTDKFHEGIKREAELFGEVFQTNDAMEGIQAFIEKREPKFTGK